MEPTTEPGSTSSGTPAGASIGTAADDAPVKLERLRGVGDWIAPGWYVACFARELKAGHALPVTIADVDLVVYRTASGQPVAQERYCPHLGGNLSSGKVVGESIRCPFHFWRYDASGACVEIPRCEKIPPRARVRTYPVAERMEAIWVYVGADKPHYELPTDAELFPGGASHCGGLNDYGEVATHSRDIFENAVDPSHGPTVHFVDVVSYEMRAIEGAFLSFDSEIEFDVGVTKLRSKTVNKLFGPGLWVVWLSKGFYRIPGVWSLLATPVTTKRTRLRAVTWVCDKGWKPWVPLLGWLYKVGMDTGATQDYAIWNHKALVERPVLSAADVGPVMGYRKWYRHQGELALAGGTDPAAPASAVEA